MKREFIFMTIVGHIVWFFILWYNEINVMVDQWLVIGLVLDLVWLSFVFSIIVIPLYSKRAVTPKKSISLETGHPFATLDAVYYEKDNKKVRIYPKYLLFAGGGGYVSKFFGWEGGGRDGGIYAIPEHLAIKLEGNWAFVCDDDKYKEKDHRKVPIHIYNSCKIRSNFSDKVPIHLGREIRYTEIEKEEPEIDHRIREEFLNERINNRDDEIDWLHGELKIVYKRHQEREGGKPRSMLDRVLKDKGERFGE